MWYKKLSILILFVITFSLPARALADGCIVTIDPYSGGVDYISEESQRALINFQDGEEKMLLEINFQSDTRDAVWILPVPANPNGVKLDIISSIPSLQGKNINEELKNIAKSARMSLSEMQIYPFFGYGMASVIGTPMGSATGGSVSSNQEKDITVHEHIEKKGLVGELITANNSTAIYDYFKNKNLAINPGSIPTLEQYIGKNYDFVATWIGRIDVKEKNIKRGIYIKFPSNNIYYPLKLTGIYNEEKMPITIQVIGLAKPTVYDDLKPFLNTNYYTKSQISLTENEGNKYELDEQEVIKDFFGTNQGKLPQSITRIDNDYYADYTKIEIEAPAKYFTDDIWMENGASPKVHLAFWAIKWDNFLTIFLLILFSALTGIITAWLIFKDEERNWALWLYGLLGMAHCLTLIGLIIALSFKKVVLTKNTSSENKEPKNIIIDKILIIFGLSFVYGFLVATEYAFIMLNSSIDELFSNPGLFYDGLGMLIFIIIFLLLVVWVNSKKKFSPKTRFIITYMEVYLLLVYSTTKLLQVLLTYLS